MAKKFKLMVGSHTNGPHSYHQGDIVISDDDLAAIHGKEKFSFVENVIDLGDAVVPEEVPSPAVKPQAKAAKG